MELKALLAQPLVLPSIPKVIALLLGELQHEAPDLRVLSQLIGTDLALTTRLLQAANAPFFKLAGKVHSVAEALAVLGLPHIRAMATDAASAASLKSVPGMVLPPFWVYSLDVAKLARSLAGVVRQNQGAAYTAGLLHALGELPLHLTLPERMAQMDAVVPLLDLRRARHQMRELGYSYAQVSAGYVQAWRFPQSIVDALAHQAAPFAQDVYEPLAGVIHLATWRVRARTAQLNERALAVTFPGEVGEVLGLDIDMVLQQTPFDWQAVKGRP